MISDKDCFVSSANRSQNVAVCDDEVDCDLSELSSDIDYSLAFDISSDVDYAIASVSTDFLSHNCQDDVDNLSTKEHLALTRSQKSPVISSKKSGKGKSKARKSVDGADSSQPFVMLPRVIFNQGGLMAGAKLLFAEIESLSHKEGYAYACNAYYANLFGVSNRSIINWMKRLQEIGAISVSYDDPSCGRGRRIFVRGGG